MDYYLILYILLSIVVITSGSYIFVKQNKMIATAVFTIGAIAVLVFYGLRWFKGDKAKSLGYEGQWPPANRINFCPDYFTMMKDSGATGKFVCVDKVGFANQGKLRQYKDEDALVKTTSAGTYRAGDQTVNAISQDALDSMEKKCQICQDLGVTWEGIYDGQTCVGLGKRTVDSSGAAASCPTTS